MSGSERTSSDDNRTPPTIKHTAVSRPTLGHTSSKQSISATEEYDDTAHSPDLRPVSSLSNDSYNDDDTERLQRFSTPPSSPRRFRDPQRQPESISTTAAPSQRNLEQMPSTRAALRRLQGEPDPADLMNLESPIEHDPFSERAASTDPREERRSDMSNRTSQIRRKPIGSGQRNSAPYLTQLNTDPGPPTPGVDDTPYIQFALDQLTRDEDILGSRYYPGGLPGLSADDEEQHRSLGLLDPRSDEGVTAVPRASSTYSQGALIADDTADPARTTGTNLYDENLNYTDIRDRTTRNPYGAEHESRLNASDPRLYVDAPEFASHTPPLSHEALNAPQPISSSLQKQQGTEDTDPRPDFFIPIYQEIVPLRFLPGILRPVWLSLYTIFVLLILALLLTTGIYSSTHEGLYSYTNFGGARYFIFKYLPTLVGMIMLLWLFQIKIALQRIAPFVAMASLSSTSRSGAPLLDWLPTNFLLPIFSYFSAGLPVVGSVLLIFWLQTFSIPLFATLYNVHYYGISPNGQWKWTTVQGVVWTLFALYLLLLVALIALAIWLWGRRTGLKWDPRSIKDLIALMDHSNIMKEFAGSEIFYNSAQFRTRFDESSFRLGYWSTRWKPADMFYGIGEEGAPTRHYSIEAGRLTEKQTDPTQSERQLLDLESSHESRYMRMYLPWYLRPSFALLWVAAGFVLYLALLIVSFVDRAVTRGFNPLLRVDVDAAGFSSANFFYSFIPTVIAELIFLCWLSVDYAFRRLQPFAAMSTNPNGASAKESLLLDYSFNFPVEVTLRSLRSGHIRIAWFSLITLLTASLPILAAGTFWSQFYISTQTVRISVHPAAYYTLCIFLALFIFTLPIILIGLRKRSLPHACTTIAENVSWLYVSGIVGEREWRAPLGSKTEIINRLTNPVTESERRADTAHGHRRWSSGGRARLTGGSAVGRFVFGRFTGRDGFEHIGIERLGRGEKRTNIATRTFRNGPGGSRSRIGSRNNSYPAGEEIQSEADVEEPRRSFVPRRKMLPSNTGILSSNSRNGGYSQLRSTSQQLSIPDVGTPFIEKIEAGPRVPGRTAVRGVVRNDEPPVGYI